MNLKEKIIEKRDTTIEWVCKHKIEIIGGIVVAVSGAFVVKNIMDTNKVDETLEFVPENIDNESPVIEERNSDTDFWSGDMWQFKERDEGKIIDFCEENKISYNTTYGQEGYTYGGKDFDINGELVFKEE